MWRQTTWRQNVASGTSVVAPPKSWKCGVKQCGVKMWRQAQMWRQSEMWRQTMWRQNVASGTPLTKLCFRKCVFKKGIQWHAQKYYTICLYPVFFCSKLQVFMNVVNPKTNLDPRPRTPKGGSNARNTSCCDSLENSVSDPRKKCNLKNSGPLLCSWGRFLDGFLAVWARWACFCRFRLVCTAAGHEEWLYPAWPQGRRSEVGVGTEPKRQGSTADLEPEASSLSNLSMPFSWCAMAWALGCLARMVFDSGMVRMMKRIGMIQLIVEHHEISEAVYTSFRRFPVRRCDQNDATNNATCARQTMPRSRPPRPPRHSAWCFSSAAVYYQRT